MPTLTSHADPSQLNGELVLSWTVHLAQECKPKLAASVLFTLVLSAFGYYTIGSLGAIATAAVMLASLADFLFPVNYKITTDGAECRMLLKSTVIRWENVRNCYLDDFGIKLSPLRKGTRLEAFRGVYLRFGKNQQQIIEAVKSLREKKCTE